MATWTGNAKPTSDAIYRCVFGLYCVAFGIEAPVLAMATVGHNQPFAASAKLRLETVTQYKG